MLQSPSAMCFEFKSTCTRISTAKVKSQSKEIYGIKLVIMTFFLFAQVRAATISSTCKGHNLLEHGLELLNQFMKHLFEATFAL